jgi:four helix bundle protein
MVRDSYEFVRNCFKTYMKTLEDLEIYQISMQLADEVWFIIDNWNYFSKDTLGKQWIRAIDSVGANISEGYGRFSYIEMRQFTRIARGSLKEHITWLTKAKNRNLIKPDIYDAMAQKSNQLSIKINNF